MTWRKAPQELVSFLEEASRNVEGSEKRMMVGFPAYSVNGNMFMATHQDSLVLRLGQADRDAILSSGEGSAQFEPMPGRVMKEYVVVSGDIYGDRTRFDALLAKSSRYVRGLPTKEPHGKRQAHKKDLEGM